MGREMRYPFIFYSTVTMTEHWRGIYCRHFLIRSLVPFLCWRDSLFYILFLVRWREILLYCSNASLHCVLPSSKSKSAGSLSQSQRAFIKKGRVTISRRLLGRTQARGGSVNISYKNRYNNVYLGVNIKQGVPNQKFSSKPYQIPQPAN